jgi:hypothetical protein
MKSRHGVAFLATILLSQLCLLSACTSLPSLKQVARLDLPIGRMLIDGNRMYTNEFGIYDISDPLNPVKLGGYDAPGATLQVAISGHYAFLANDNANLEIIDIADPTNPVRVASVYSTAAMAIAAEGNYAYFVDASLFVNALRIFDITDPEDPIEIAAVQDLVNLPKSRIPIAVRDHYLYLFQYASGIGEEDTLQIMDVSDPTTPRIVASPTTVFLPMDIDFAAEYAYVVGVGSGPKILNVADPANPVVVGRYSGSLAAESIAVDGQYAYVPARLTFHVLDVSNPKWPRLVARQEMAQAFDAAIVGDYVYVADAEGLFIYERLH